MAGKFEIYEDKGGKHRFRLKASNGVVVAVGEAYGTPAAARKATESVQQAADGAVVEVSGDDGLPVKDETPPSRSWLVYQPNHPSCPIVKVTADRIDPAYDFGMTCFYDANDDLVAQFPSSVGVARADLVS